MEPLERKNIFFVRLLKNMGIYINKGFRFKNKGRHFWHIGSCHIGVHKKLGSQNRGQQRGGKGVKSIPWGKQFFKRGQLLPLSLSAI